MLLKKQIDLLLLNFSEAQKNNIQQNENFNYLISFLEHDSALYNLTKLILNSTFYQEEKLHLLTSQKFKNLIFDLYATSQLNKEQFNIAKKILLKSIIFPYFNIYSAIQSCDNIDSLTNNLYNIQYKKNKINTFNLDSIAYSTSCQII